MKTPIKFEDMVRANAGVWLETYGYVRTTSGKVERLKRMNILQRRILAVYIAGLLTGKPVRVIGLKPRKKGFSTMVSALHYSQLQNFPHEGVVIGNKLATSEEIFGMTKLFAEMDQFRKWGSPIKSNTTEKVVWEHGAKLTQETANSKDTCRGKTPQFMHSSEVAHWTDGEPSLISALNAIPDHGFTAAFLESTPFGNEGPFADTWQQARWAKPAECPEGKLYWKQWESMCPDQPVDLSGVGDRNFVRVFAAWFEFEDSRLKLTDAQKSNIRDTIDLESWYDGERNLIDLYGNEGPNGQRLGQEVADCDLWEQLAWRRMIIKTKCRGLVRKFHEEYPHDPTSCFLSSGQQVFDTEAITSLQILSRKYQPKYGQLTEKQGGANVVWTPCQPEAAMFMQWEGPQPGQSYLISVDLSEGEDQTKGANPDRHSALVWRRHYFDANRVWHPTKLVARVRPPCRMPMIPFAQAVARLSSYYGGCMVIPEMNNSGMAFITALKLLQDRPPIWQRREMDPHSGRERGHDGWRTTDNAEYGGVRSTIIWHLHDLLRNGKVEIACPNVISELAAFVDKQGRMEAGGGAKDDDVMSTAIGLFNIDSATEYSDASRSTFIPNDLKKIEGQMGRDRGLAMKW